MILWISYSVVLLNVYLKADLTCIIMASIRIIVTAYMFGEVMLCSRTNSADRATILCAFGIFIAAIAVLIASNAL